MKHKRVSCKHEFISSPRFFLDHRGKGTRLSTGKHSRRTYQRHLLQHQRTCRWRRRVIRKIGGTCSLEWFAQQHPNPTLRLHPIHSLPPTHLGNVLREVVVPLAKLPWCSHRCFFALEKCEKKSYRLAFIMQSLLGYTRNRIRRLASSSKRYYNTKKRNHEASSLGNGVGPRHQRHRPATGDVTKRQRWSSSIIYCIPQRPPQVIRPNSIGLGKRVRPR